MTDHPPQRHVRDNDNLEIRDILNMINTYLLTDDSGLLCDVFLTAEIGETDITQIFVMPKHLFPEWLIGRKNLNLQGKKALIFRVDIYYPKRCSTPCKYRG